MYHIAICDDELAQRALIRSHIENFCQKHNEAFTLHIFTNPSDLIDALDNNLVIDIALLDIVMPGLLGTELAKEIKRKSPHTEILFLTTSDEFALDAFSVHALDYILKPFTQDRFARSMNLVLKQLAQRQQAKIVFHPTSDTVRILEIAHIVYIESNGHVLKVHTTEGETIEVRKPLQDLLDDLQALAPDQFVSPIRGFVINLTQVQKITPETIHVPGAQIPLGKRKYRLFQKQYFDFMFAADRKKNADIR